MRINNTALAVLMAAMVGSGLIACQRAGEDQGARSQGSSAPVSQAPTQAPVQGYTGPATPADAAADKKDAQPATDSGSASSPTAPATNPSKQSAGTEQQKPAD